MKSAFRFYSLVLAASLLITTFIDLNAAHAQGISGYPSARRNADLREQVENDPDRLVPKFERFTVAGDGEIFYRLLGNEDFYHGIGYWMQVRSELRPSDRLRLNMRTIFFSGSVSEGYARPTGFYNLFSVTTEWPEIFWGLNFKARGLDLDRQTVGAGLLIQNKEFNGALLSLSRGESSFTIRAEGTGVLLLSDDTYNAELNLGGGWFGAGVVLWPAGQEQAFLEKDRAPYAYLFSTKDLNAFSYGLEVGRREDAWAGLASIGARLENGGFRVQSKIEGRRYEDRFGNGFVNLTEHQYISYDQYDKAFTDAINVFVFDDNAWVTAAHLNLFYDFNHTWRVFSLNEIGRFDFADVNDEVYYYYRVGGTYCPLPNRNDCLNLFVSNKVLQDSYRTPPERITTSNTETLFKSVPFVGLEGRFSF